MESLRSSAGDSRGDRLPARLTGVGMLELELTDDVLSCRIPWFVWGDVSAGGGQFPML
jgi:hypothetical protein